MVTAKNALESLVSAGLITSFRRRKEDEYGFSVTVFDVEGEIYVSNETYGKKSFLYFSCKSPETAKRVLSTLRSLGAKPGTDWNGGLTRGCLDLRVSYFKGRRWWE